MQLVVNDLLTSYRAKGKGRLIVLLHGWGDDSSTFDLIADKLSQNYRVIALDLPGFGQTQPPPATWNLDDYAQFVRDFIEKLNLPAPLVIIGHSNGGALSIRGLASDILKTEKLVLLAASGVRNQQSYRRFGYKIAAKTGKAASFFLPGQTRQQLRRKLYETVGSDMLIAPHMEETFKNTVRQDVQQDARKLVQPTLLLYGTNDTVTPPKYGSIYHRLIDNSRLEVIEGAGHFIHHDRPDLVINYIMKFL